MAREVGVKVFRTYTDVTYVNYDSIPKVSKAIEDWYTSGCANYDLENIFLGTLYATRPKYEKL